MDIVQAVSDAVQEELGTYLDELARECQLIKRQRKLTGQLLLRILVLTLLQKPDATPEDFLQTAATLDLAITSTGLEKRWKAGQPLVDFLKLAFEHALKRVIAAQPNSAKLFRAFSAVFVGDSSTIPLDPELAELFPGCGGKEGTSGAALKLHVLWNLKTGCIEQFQITEARASDINNPIAQAEYAEPNTLWVYDLGYFDLKRFATLQKRGAAFISRLQFVTKFTDLGGQSWELLDYLRQQPPGVVDAMVFLGAVAKMSCRLLAVRVPEEVANRRRQKAQKKLNDRGKTMSAAYSELLGWSVFITNINDQVLTWKGVVILYRARWQVELLFKLWKSHNALEKHQGEKPAVCQLAWLYARLLGVLFQHWLLLGLAWQLPERSLFKAADLLRNWVVTLLVALNEPIRFVGDLKKLQEVIEQLAKVRKRKKQPSHAQLIENEEWLEWIP